MGFVSGGEWMRGFKRFACWIVGWSSKGELGMGFGVGWDGDVAGGTSIACICRDSYHPYNCKESY